MPFSTILFDVADAIATLTLNRPDKLNAFSATMRTELGEAMQRVQSDSGIRVLLVTGAGRGFCAGADLSERVVTAERGPSDLGSSLETHYNPFIRRLRALPFPVICAVNGVAAGAGCNLALAGDIVIAARSASFIQAFSRIGLVPDAGGTWILPRLVGMARAMALALTADKVSAEQAAEWGMIWKCVDDEKFRAEVQQLAVSLASGPTKAYGLIKQALYASSSNDLATQLAVEARLQRDAGASEDFQEGVRAFLEKRPARFAGR